MMDDEQAVSGTENEVSSRCPACGSKLAGGAVLCVQCGFNVATGRKATTPIGAEADHDGEGALAEQELSADDRSYMLKQRKIPLAILGAGLCIGAFLVWQEARGHEAFGDLIFPVLGEILKQVMIGVGLLVIAAFVAARVLGTSFGELGPAILKFAAIYVTPSALAELAGSFAGDGYWIVAIPVSLVLYYSLLVWLFDLDQFEAWVYTVIAWMINAGVSAST